MICIVCHEGNFCCKHRFPLTRGGLNREMLSVRCRVSFQNREMLSVRCRVSFQNREMLSVRCRVSFQNKDGVRRAFFSFILFEQCYLFKLFLFTSINSLSVLIREQICLTASLLSPTEVKHKLSPCKANLP